VEVVVEVVVVVGSKVHAPVTGARGHVPTHLWRTLSMCGKVTNVALNNISTPTYAFANWNSKSIASPSLIPCTLKLMYSVPCTPTEANPEQETN
jgi:hypothetical protein